jgi:hypothetical protein
MATVVAGMTMSLDGFVTDREGGVDRLPVSLAAIAWT